MIIEKMRSAKKNLSVALALALFVGGPSSALAQVRVGAVDVNIPSVNGSVGAANTVLAPSALANTNVAASLGGSLVFSAPSLNAASVELPSFYASKSVIPAAMKPTVRTLDGVVAARPAMKVATKPGLISAIAAAQSLPVGKVADVMANFVGTLTGAKTQDGKVLFDGAVKHAGEDEEGAAVGEDGEEVEVPAAAQALHDEWHKTAEARLAAWEKKVTDFRIGKLGVMIQYQLSQDGRMGVAQAYTIDGQPVDPRMMKPALIAAGVSAQDWNAAKPRLDAQIKTFIDELVSTIQQNEQEHQAVHQKMNEMAREVAIKSAKESLAKGKDLQTWGIPVSISVNQKTALRYARTYRLNGMPTDLGYAIHDLIAPLVKADPTFLSKVTHAQLHEAVQYLQDSLRYSLDPSTPDGMKKLRMAGATKGEGYDYPVQRKALVDLARKKLLEKPLEGDVLAGLGTVPEADQPGTVMMGIFKELTQQYEQKVNTGNATPEEVAKMEGLLIAFHQTIGLPVMTSQGPLMLPITHKQMIPIIAELSRRNAPAEVIKSVIRTFPLGESIVRLGVVDLWARGITGKGVKIAVIDNGVDFAHPDLKDVENPVVENFTRDLGKHAKGDHATPMASIAHAIAPDAEIQSYQALSNVGLPGVALNGEETNDALLKAMDRAKENGAHIISMSLGAAMAYSNDSMVKKVKEMTDAGIVVIVSAGNSGDELPKGFQVGSPGTAPEAITVGAVDYHGKIAPFSSEGVVFNPTEGTAAEKPEIYASGVNVKAAISMPEMMYQMEPVPYNPVSGTSPATPHVSGVVALMLQAAREAGADITQTTIPQSVKESLMAGIARINRLPVLSDAEKAARALIEKLLGHPIA